MCISRTCTTKTYVTIRLTMYTNLLHYYRFQSEHNWKGVCNHLERKKHLLCRLLHIYHNLPQANVNIHDSHVVYRMSYLQSYDFLDKVFQHLPSEYGIFKRHVENRVWVNKLGVQDTPYWTQD